MTQNEREKILRDSAVFFRERAVKEHIDHIRTLQSLDEFDRNPLLYRYIARLVFGDDSPESLAKTLFYPRVLGSSLSSVFERPFRFFCSDVLSDYASLEPGMDIEFIDASDGRRKYCQVTCGPASISASDADTIIRRFGILRDHAKVDRRDLRISDCVVALLYGTPGSCSVPYQRVAERYPVYMGSEFWYRFTGDSGFYGALTDALTEAVQTLHASDAVSDVVAGLSEAIERQTDSKAGRQLDDLTKQFVSQ